MTEDEAKTKWCPMVNGPHNVNTTLRRGCDDGPPELKRNPPEARCIASACMMWRYKYLQHIPVTGGPIGMTIKNTSQESGGYCGLAGAEP